MGGRGGGLGLQLNPSSYVGQLSSINGIVLLVLARITYSHRSPRVSRTGKMPLLPFESMANQSVTQKRLKLLLHYQR